MILRASTSHDFCYGVRNMTYSKALYGLALLIGHTFFCGSNALANPGIDIVIEGNPELATVDGLEGVSALNSLSIKSNPKLADLDGLLNLERVSNSLGVETNEALTDCRALAPVLGWPDGEDAQVGSATISGNPANCADVQDVLDSVFGPTPPGIVGRSFSSAVGEDGYSLIDMNLDFVPATERERIFPVTGHRVSCTSEEFASDSNIGAPLLDFAPVSRRLDLAGSAGPNESSFTAEIQVGIDITHTDPVDLVVSLRNPEAISRVLWNQSSPNSEDLVGTFPTTLSPAESLSTLSRERMGGPWTLVVEDVSGGPIIREGILNSWSMRVTEESVSDGSVSPPITVKGVGQRVSYRCRLTALSKLGATPVSAEYSLVVPGVPAQPSISSTDYEDGAISLYATVGDDGGSPITGFTAACRSGATTVIANSSTSPITLSGLTNGVSYVCSVTATNALGTSVASALTAPISPQEIFSGLPIWLLFQATQ